MNTKEALKNNTKVDKPKATKASQQDETAKLICSLISLFYSMQAEITSEPANDNDDFEGGDDDSVA